MDTSKQLSNRPKADPYGEPHSENTSHYQRGLASVAGHCVNAFQRFINLLSILPITAWMILAVSAVHLTLWLVGERKDQYGVISVPSSSPANLPVPKQVRAHIQAHFPGFHFIDLRSDNAVSLFGRHLFAKVPLVSKQITVIELEKLTQSTKTRQEFDTMEVYFDTDGNYVGQNNPQTRAQETVVTKDQFSKSQVVTVITGSTLPSSQPTSMPGRFNGVVTVEIRFLETNTCITIVGEYNKPNNLIKHARQITITVNEEMVLQVKNCELENGRISGDALITVENPDVRITDLNVFYTLLRDVVYFRAPNGKNYLITTFNKQPSDTQTLQNFPPNYRIYIIKSLAEAFYYTGLREHIIQGNSQRALYARRQIPKGIVLLNRITQYDMPISRLAQHAPTSYTISKELAEKVVTANSINIVVVNRQLRNVISIWVTSTDIEPGELVVHCYNIPGEKLEDQGLVLFLREDPNRVIPYPKAIGEGVIVDDPKNKMQLYDAKIVASVVKKRWRQETEFAIKRTNNVLNDAKIPFTLMRVTHQKTT